ncbi:hypothetical protein D3C71_1906780 [compost metagenome]
MQRLEGLRHRQALDLGAVAQLVEQQAGHGVGGDQVGPADVGQTHQVAAGGFGGVGQQRAAQGERQQVVLGKIHRLIHMASDGSLRGFWP